MDKKEATNMALKLAAMSPCRKRKVGAVIIDKTTGEILSKGFNYNSSQEGWGFCEDINGRTLDTVIHAEVAAINNLITKLDNKDLLMLVTHEPCANCVKKMIEAGIRDFQVVEEFMKFDTGKLRYDLVPPSAFEGLAKVLTYGAKKYKPNNWRNVEGLDRYVAALYRHLEAWRKGEQFDEESGLKHLEHAMTNICFLLELDPDDSGSDEAVRD